MYLKLEMFTVKCDNCGETSGDNADYSCWNDEQTALNEAQECGWTQEDDKHYCPNCYHYDDDDNLILKSVKL